MTNFNLSKPQVHASNTDKRFESLLDLTLSVSEESALAIDKISMLSNALIPLPEKYKIKTADAAMPYACRTTTNQLINIKRKKNALKNMSLDQKLDFLQRTIADVGNNTTYCLIQTQDLQDQFDQSTIPLNPLLLSMPKIRSFFKKIFH